MRTSGSPQQCSRPQPVLNGWTWAQVHYERGEEGILAEALDQLLGQWEDFCTERNGQCSQLIWRETTPQHFEGGFFQDAQSLNEECVALRPSELETGNAYNLATDPILRKYPRVLRLPAWRMLSHRPDAHMKGECTHWCQPGVLEKLVHVLYGVLLAHRARGGP
jgi:hypothetical protein